MNMDPENVIIEDPDTEEPDEELVEDEPQEEASDAEEGEGEPAESGDDDGEISITIGDEPAANDEESLDGNDIPPEKSGGLINDLRRKLKLASREAKQLRAQIDAGAQPAKPAEVVLGEKPKMSDPDIDFDEEKFSERLDQWHEQKRKADDLAAQKQRAEQQVAEEWKGRLTSYEKAKAALPVKDFDEAEEIAKDVLSITQQGIILQGTQSPEKIVYALGKNPKKAKELAAINDPVRFAVEIGKLETQLKVTKRNAPPPPERVVRSNVTGAAAVDNQAERLRAEARKTGDYSKVSEFNRAQRAKAQQRKA